MKNWRQFVKLYILSFLKYPASRLTLGHKHAHVGPSEKSKQRDKKVTSLSPTQQIPSRWIALLIAARARDLKVSLLSGYFLRLR